MEPNNKQHEGMVAYYNPMEFNQHLSNKFFFQVLGKPQLKRIQQ